MKESALRALPSIDRVAAALDAPHALAVAAARRAVARQRHELRHAPGGPTPDPGVLLATAVARAREDLAARERGSLRRVLNATGVILHTNLGRAPLALVAREALARTAEGYTSLELDARTGRRGSRQDHVASALCELTGAQDALVVNNGAAAALLAVAALAGPGGHVVVSRGQLVEIGGGFRIPEVIEQAGARLVEVGTTNRTRVEDYRRALAGLPGERTIVLRAHPSNFRTVGFVESVEVEALCELGVPVVDDLGSGALDRAIPALAEEPDVRRSLAAGAALVTFSGDKLLGGPQAGILVGTQAAVEAAGHHPLARAMRIDKLSLAALAATLDLYRDPARARAEVPVLAMLETGGAALRARAERIAAPLGGRAVIESGSARVGGGSLPLLELDGPVVAVDTGPLAPTEVATRLRADEVMVVGRIERGRLLLDPRTLTDEEADEVARRVADALAES